MVALISMLLCFFICIFSIFFFFFRGDGQLCKPPVKAIRMELPFVSRGGQLLLWLCGWCKVRQRGAGSGWEESWAAVLPGPRPHCAGFGSAWVKGSDYALRLLPGDGPKVFGQSLVCSGQTQTLFGQISKQ